MTLRATQREGWAVLFVTVNDLFEASRFARLGGSAGTRRLKKKRSRAFRLWWSKLSPAMRKDVQALAVSRAQEWNRLIEDRRAGISSCLDGLLARAKALRTGGAQRAAG